MLIRAATLGALSAWTVVAMAPAAAANPAPTRRVVVAPGVVAEYTSQACAAQQLGYGPCAGWSLHGGAAPLPDSLTQATAFAGAPGARIVAAVRQGLYVSDDRGAHWQSVRWEWPGSALALDFDPRSGFGAAVGSNGAVWTTEDRGSSWRARRDGGGRNLTDVAVAGHTLVFVDAAGGAWVSTDGGTSVRTLAEGGPGTAPARLESEGGAVWVQTGGALWWRADASGSVERVERSSRRR